MPTNKDFKRLVRARMRQTGEAYTTARTHLLQRNRRLRPQSSPSLVPSPADYATIAGKSDALIKSKTGCIWERWVRALDRVGAAAWPHRQIAEHITKTYRISGWWSQTVTVGYERIKGLRVIGQRRDGSFEATKSKTFAVPLRRLYRAWSDPRLRAQWLPDAGLTVRSATRDKSMNITWPDRTSLTVGFTETRSGKSQVAVQHAKLRDKPKAAAMKAYWEERLAALGEILAAN